MKAASTLTLAAILLALSLAATTAPASALVPLPGEIAFVRGGDIWVMDRVGGSAHAIVATPDKESDPRWEPGGNVVAFTRKSAHLNVWTRDIYSTATARLAQGTAGDDFAPAFSPDGSRIAFFSTRDHAKEDMPRAELYTMRPDGTGQRRVTKSRGGLDNPVDARFSPNGKMVAVEEAGTGGGHGASLVDLATGRTRPAISDAALAAAGYKGPSVGLPAWSPGAQDIVAVALHDLAADAGDPKNGLFVMRLGPDGRFSDSRELVKGDVSHPTWSPDGKRVACTFYPGATGKPEVWVVDAAGGEPRRLAADAEQPDWRPPAPGTMDTELGGSTGGGVGGSGSGGTSGGAKRQTAPCCCCGCFQLLGLLAAVGLGVVLKR